MFLRFIALLLRLRWLLSLASGFATKDTIDEHQNIQV